MQINEFNLAVALIGLALGVFIRSFVPYLRKFFRGKLNRYDYSYAVTSFVSLVGIGLPITLFLVAQFTNPFLIFVLAFFIGAGGNDFLNQFLDTIKIFRKPPLQ